MTRCSLLLLFVTVLAPLSTSASERDLMLLDASAEIVSAEVALNFLSTGAAESLIRDMFGHSIGTRAEERTNTLALFGQAHAVEAAIALLKQRDVAAPQVLFEIALVTVSKKGRKAARAWLDEQTWSPSALDDAADRGEITVLSRPSVTTVLERAASIRDVSCNPFEGEVPRDPYCPEGFLSSGVEIELMPRAHLPEGTLVEASIVLTDTLQRRTRTEVVLVPPEADVALRVPDGPGGDTWIFISAALHGTSVPDPASVSAND